MLSLGRRQGEQIVLCDDERIVAAITVLDVEKGRMRLYVDALPEIDISRREKTKERAKFNVEQDPLWLKITRSQEIALRHKERRRREALELTERMTQNNFERQKES